MEEKHRNATPQPPSNADSPASEQATTRRRGGAQKRKASALSASNSSSTPSKRVTREKPLPPHTPSHHNGPLTRARQIPSNLSGSSALSSSTLGGGFASTLAAVKHSERLPKNGGTGGDSAVAPSEELNKESEWDALEAAVEARFEAIRSRAANAQVVPAHCDIHSIEKRTLSSFFNGKNENRTPNTYMEIRNFIMKRFHANPNIQIELKDLLELNVGELDARQEVMEFLDYWGLINFHPFPSTDSSVASADDDRAVEKNSLLEKLYRFESLQFQSFVPKTNLMTPAMTSGLFTESAIAEELAKQEEPSVEYHCNSCSADCSHKRYHCQKQEDFDLCTNCFSNGKFGSGMSSSDFLLMEPAEVPGVSGGKWTDQETLLLLEAIELYKENWNEIAEHVATKSKTQCILHFVQMPIEDVFVDRGDDDVDAICNENADLATTTNDSSVHKDASEFVENKISDNIEGHVLTNETSKAEDGNKVKVNLEIPKLEDERDEKTCEGISKSEDGVKVNPGQEADNGYSLNALDEAFATLGCSPGPECPSSFAEVGNPVMALAVFLARLVGSDVAVASAHNSLKSMPSINSPSTKLFAKHCFLLEDPPDDKEPNSYERDSKREGDQDDRNVKQDKSMLDDISLSNDHSDYKIEDNDLEDTSQLTSPDDGVSEKPIALKEQAKVNVEVVGLANCNDPSNSEIPNDQEPSTVSDSDGSKIPSTSEELGEGTLVKEPCQAAGELKKGHVSDTLPLDNNAVQQSIKSNLAEEHPQHVETPKDVGLVPDSMLSDKSKPQKLPSVGRSSETTDSLLEVDMVSNSFAMETNGSHVQIASVSSQHTGTEKDVNMVPSSMSLDKNGVLHPDKSNSGAVNGHSAGEDRAEDDTQVKGNSKKTKHDNNFEKAKRAVVSTLAAAAVKAKLLANEEEDQIRQLASLLIEKQLHKLETKLAFFKNMDNVTMRVRELLLQSRQKLFQQRALIIASQLGGLPASSSRGVPSSLPINRVPMNFANSIARSQIMNPQRPPFYGPVGTIATTLPNPLADATAAGQFGHPARKAFLLLGENKC